MNREDLVDKPELPATVVHRIQQTLAQRVVDLKVPYSLSYSTRDIERQQKLTSAQHQALQRDWHQEHFSTAFRPFKVMLWVAAGFTSWLLLTDQDGVRSIAGGLLDGVPSFVLFTVGAFLGFGVWFTSRLAIDGLTAGQHWEGFRAGYEEGLRQGVNRALGINPQQEQAMRAASREAQLASLGSDND